MNFAVKWHPIEPQLETYRQKSGWPLATAKKVGVYNWDRKKLNDRHGCDIWLHPWLALTALTVRLLLGLENLRIKSWGNVSFKDLDPLENGCLAGHPDAFHWERWEPGFFEKKTNLFVIQRSQKGVQNSLVWCFWSIWRGCMGLTIISFLIYIYIYNIDIYIYIYRQGRYLIYTSYKYISWFLYQTSRFPADEEPTTFRRAVGAVGDLDVVVERYVGDDTKLYPWETEIRDHEENPYDLRNYGWHTNTHTHTNCKV